MRKQLTVITGEVFSLSKPLHVERLKKASFTKKTLGIITKDQQKVFFELREPFLEELKVGDNVTIEFYFAGSIKEEKSYNNLIVANAIIHE